MVIATVRRKGAEMIIVCEPNRARVQAAAWTMDERMDAALVPVQGSFGESGAG